LATGSTGTSYTISVTGTNLTLTSGGTTFVSGTAPTGTFSVQTCLDYQTTLGNTANANFPGNWVTIPLSAIPTVSGASTVIEIAFNQIPAPWIQVVWTNGSGAGLLNGYIYGKAV
jgi:hypothetical protein